MREHLYFKEILCSLRIQLTDTKDILFCYMFRVFIQYYSFSNETALSNRTIL